MQQHDFMATIFTTAKKYPHRKALSKGKSSYTYKELVSAINNVSNNLVQQGMKAGDRVFFSVKPDAKGLVLALGVIAGGGVIVFADPMTAPKLFDERVKLSKPAIVVAESVLYFANTSFGKYISKKKDIVIPDYIGINATHYYAGHKLPGAPQGSKPISKLHKGNGSKRGLTDPSQEAVLVFTSGTTSDPKCVRHSRNTIGSGMEAFVDKCAINEQSHIYTDHFNYGITALTVGGHWEIPENPPAKNVQKWVQALSQRNVTHTFLVPSDVTLMLNEIEAQNITVPLGSLSTGAAPVLPTLIQRINKLMPNTSVYAIYGMTEMLPIAIIDGKEKLDYTQGDIAGPLQPGIGAKLDTTVTMEQVASHASTAPHSNRPIGELIISGEGLMMGYLGKEDATNHRTGDMATIDGNGNLVLLGRIKDMLIRANKNIYPGLYEPNISLIKGVEEAAIVGVQDAYGEDVVVLFISKENKKEDDREFRKSIASELIAALDGDSQPDAIITIDSIPKAGRSNKPDRVELRKLASENYKVQNLLKAQEPL